VFDSGTVDFHTIKVGVNYHFRWNGLREHRAPPLLQSSSPAKAG